jgi:hypothetical protein
MASLTKINWALANRLLAASSTAQYQRLFVTDPEARRNDVLETLVEIVYEALNSVANNFKSFDDPFWTMVMDVMHYTFNSVGTEPDGVTPFQQRLMLKIVHKLKDNVNGFYPAILRVLLAAVGPYEHQVAQPNATAFPASNGLSPLMAGQLWLAAEDHTPRLRPLASLAGSRPDKFPFELGKTA